MGVTPTTKRMNGRLNSPACAKAHESLHRHTEQPRMESVETIYVSDCRERGLIGRKYKNNCVYRLCELQRRNFKDALTVYVSSGWESHQQSNK